MASACDAGQTRCAWAKEGPLRVYHDSHWGVPVQDDQLLFEMLLLEGAQAGLSWETVLKRRESYRLAFDGFDLEKVARYGEADKKRLLADPGIIRNRAKVESAINNAARAIEAIEECGSLAALFWGLAGGRPATNHFARPEDVPADTPQSRAMSKALKKRGFTFVGPTIAYAFMQSVGMVNDHLEGCFRHGEVALLAARANEYPSLLK